MPSTDTYGVWTLVRAEADYDEMSDTAFEDMENDYFGYGEDFVIVDGDEYCVEDYTFGSTGPWEGDT